MPSNVRVSTTVAANADLNGEVCKVLMGVSPKEAPVQPESVQTEDSLRPLFNSCAYYARGSYLATACLKEGLAMAWYCAGGRR
eukprot:2386727-Alexandrium_andersonii.AAC.1